MKPCYKDWEFNSNWRRSRLPFHPMKASEVDMKINSKICDFMKRNGEDRKLITISYCIDDKLHDLYKKVVETCECCRKC